MQKEKGFTSTYIIRPPENNGIHKERKRDDDARLGVASRGDKVIHCCPGTVRDCARCRLFFVSTLTYSLSSRASSRSFCTAMNAFPRICNASARKTALSRVIVGSFNTRSHVSRSTESISSFAP